MIINQIIINTTGIFNSNWNFEQFTKRFELPTEKCLVIKNGIENIDFVLTEYKKDDPIKIIHHCTPWRGLSVLLGAMQLIKNPLITLDVYSSTEVYGQYFYNQNDHHYHDLYNQAKQLSNVNYIGYNFGALYETGAEFPMYVPYSDNYKNLARKFATGIEVAAESLQEPGIRDHLKMQKKYVNNFYDWKIRGNSWTRFLKGAINAKQ